MHAFLHKSRRENHRRVVFTQQDTIYLRARAHLVLTNLLITSSVFFPMIFFVSASKISFDFLLSYRLLFWYLLFRYRWAHHLCFLSMNDLSRSSFFDLSMHLYTKVRENHRRVVFTQQDTIYSRAHLVLTNLLITSLLVLCFSQWFLLFLPPKFLLISCRPIDSYSDICYLGTYELTIFVSFLWMIWVDLPFLIVWRTGYRYRYQPKKIKKGRSTQIIHRKETKI